MVAAVNSDLDLPHLKISTLCVILENANYVYEKKQSKAYRKG